MESGAPFEATLLLFLNEVEGDADRNVQATLDQVSNEHIAVERVDQTRVLFGEPAGLTLAWSYEQEQDRNEQHDHQSEEHSAQIDNHPTRLVPDFFKLLVFLSPLRRR